MPTVSQTELVRQIHDSSRRLVLVATGGGSEAISDLLRVPGASRSVLAATVPYCEAALTELLGARPEQFCSSWTARQMAMAAFLKARTYAGTDDVVGIGCTASLASDRPKRGEHRAYVAHQTPTATASISLPLTRNARGRAEEETVVASLILNQAAEACGTAGRLALPLEPEESLTVEHVDAPIEQQYLLAGKTDSVPLHAATTGQRPRAIFPGAFNPLHEGHRTMASVAAELLGCDVAFEISIVNVDKPPLDFLEIQKRAAQFSPSEAVWLSRSPVFGQKADVFAGATFVVGADTIERIGQIRYYGDSQQRMDQAFDHIRARGCRFLVFGRVVAGEFQTLESLQVPAALRALCQSVPESRFRRDLSSTQLRQAQQTPN